HAARDTELAAKDRHVFGHDRRAAVEIAGHDVAGLEGEQFAHGDAAAAEHGGEVHLGVLDLLLERLHPALVVLHPVAGHAGIEQLAQRLDHGVRHGDMDVPSATVELDVETGD